VILLLAAPALALPTLLALRVDDVGGRRALTIITSSAMATPEVRREGDSLIVPLAASVPPSFVAPGPKPPLTDIGFERGPFGINLRLRLARAVPYSVQHGGSVVQIVFGAEKPVPAAGPAASTTALFQSLFRAAPDPAVASAGSLADQAQPSAVAGEAAVRGFRLGPFRFDPTVAVNYWDGRSSLGETAEPLPNRYLEIQPQLLGELSLLQGRLKLGYEPRLRGYSSIPAVNRRSDRAQAALDAPFGAFTIRGGHTITTGILETTEVDPGREYFFRLGRFTRHQSTAEVQLQPGGRLGLDLGAGRDTVRLDDHAAFFDHETQFLRAAVDYALAPDRQIALGYVFDRIPTPLERPEAASRAHTVDARLYGEILPLLRAEGSVGYRQQSNPNAAFGGRRYRGSVFAFRLLKDFTPGTSLSVSLGRSTPPSSFEANGFYVATSIQAVASSPLPFGFTLRGALGTQRNGYRVVAAAISRPREDRIDGWTLGLGRAFGRHAHLRVDYRAERRESNLDAFDSRARGLVIQVGILASRSS
jgi:hypothetical protein